MEIVRRVLSSVCLFICLSSWAAILAPAQQAAPTPHAGPGLTAEQAQALVDRALANELRAAQNASHPMRYLLRKTTPRLTATRDICETKEGDVARLRSINNAPLSADADQRELARLTDLENDSGKQRHRKQSEDADTARALEVLRMLPSAFVYQYAGPGDGSGAGQNGSPAGASTRPIEKFTFRPNPQFNPPDLETQVLTAMSGAIWIDPAAERVTRLEGHLEQDVDFGWGILGRLYKGGWITIDQAEVQPGVWRTVKFQMQMNARVVFKTKSFDTTEEESRFAPLPAGLGYQQAIEMLKSGAGPGEQSRR
jgi:hypothetical protein